METIAARRLTSTMPALAVRNIDNRIAAPARGRA
jgi:hypothetical protein